MDYLKIIFENKMNFNEQNSYLSQYDEMKYYDNIDSGNTIAAAVSNTKNSKKHYIFHHHHRIKDRVLSICFAIHNFLSNFISHFLNHQNIDKIRSMDRFYKKILILMIWTTMILSISATPAGE